MVSCGATLKRYFEGPAVTTRCARTDEHSGQEDQPHRARQNGKLLEWWEGKPLGPIEDALGYPPNRGGWRRGGAGE